MEYKYLCCSECEEKILVGKSNFIYDDRDSIEVLTIFLNTHQNHKLKYCFGDDEKEKEYDYIDVTHR